MFRKKKIIVLVLIIAVVGGFFWYRSSRPPLPIQTERVTLGSVIETVSVTGELVPKQYADLSFQGVGRAKEVFYASGDAIRRGDVLATINNDVLNSQLNESRIALEIAEKNEMLAHRSWDSMKPEERQAEKLETEQARENVRTVLAQIRQSSIVAPMDGFLSKVDIRPGETVSSGKVVMRAVKDNDLIIEAQIPESDITKIAVGTKAKVTFDALPTDTVFEAEVTNLDLAATVVQDVVSYKAKFVVKNIDTRLREGMTANVDIVTAEANNVLTVPFRALTKEGGKTFAQVKQGDGSLRKEEVVVGIEGDEGTVEILSGLKEGDEVTLGTKQAN